MRLILMLVLAAGLFSPALAADSDDKVRIVVMRLKQGFGAQVPADILEVKDGRQEFIGRLWQDEMLVIETTPEKKHFMTMGLGRGEFFFTEPLQPGKTYFVQFRFHPGSGAIIPNPVRPAGDASAPAAALKGYKTVVPSSADRDAFAKERSTALVQSEYERVGGLYAKKDANQIAERTLRAQDAFNAAPK